MTPVKIEGHIMPLTSTRQCPWPVILLDYQEMAYHKACEGVKQLIASDRFQHFKHYLLDTQPSTKIEFHSSNEMDEILDPLDSPQIEKNGNTELHVAIWNDQFQLARQLILDGADCKAKNADSYNVLDIFKLNRSQFTKEKVRLFVTFIFHPDTQKEALSYLEELVENEKKHHTDAKIANQILLSDSILNNKVLSKIHSGLCGKSIGTILADKVAVLDAPSKDEEDTFRGLLRKMFADLEQIPEFVPLLKIAAYGTLGYFSNKHRELKILCEADKELVINKAVGLYARDLNIIYVAGKREERLLRSTLIHEITHYVASEVIGNGANPYFAGDAGKVNKNFFDELQRDLSKVDCTSDLAKGSVLTQMLIHEVELYPDPKRHSELFARVPELISLGVYRIKPVSEGPLDASLKNSRIYIYPDSNTWGTNLKYAFKDSTGKITREPLWTVCDLPILIESLGTTETPSKIEIEDFEKLLIHFHFFQKELALEGIKILDETFKKLKDFYTNEFLPHCEKYLLEFPVKKDLI